MLTVFNNIADAILNWKKNLQKFNEEIIKEHPLRRYERGNRPGTNPQWYDDKNWPGVWKPPFGGPMNVTHFGYPSDPNWDSASGRGEGKWIKHMEARYDVALNRQARA